MQEVRAPGIIVIADSVGIRPPATATDLRELLPTDFFWVDVSVGDDAIRTAVLNQLGLEAPDVSWALRFGQTPDMVIDRRGLRAVTWLGVPSGVATEVHVLCSERCVLTLWDGDPAALTLARAHFAERAAELNRSRYLAAAVVLQLLLGTLNEVINTLDTRLHDVRQQLQPTTAGLEFTAVAHQLQTLHSRWAAFDRYSNAVRSAMVAVEAVPGMDASGASELNDYASQVEHTEHRLQVRNQWGSSILQDYAMAIAHRQGDQINRLTLVSLIFLPITFLTGFFGMNFGWMNEAIGSAPAFVALGVVLPALSVTLTAVWLRHRGLI